MKKKLVSVAVGYAFLALGSSSVCANEFDRIPAEESQFDVREDASDDEKSKSRRVLGGADVGPEQSDDLQTMAVLENVEPTQSAQRTILEGTASGVNSIAIGVGSSATSNYSIAIGERATSSAGNSIAIGSSAAVSTVNAVAVGARAKVTGGNSVALGSDSTATANNSVALGQNSIADQQNSVSVGNGTIKRSIKNLANGAVSAGSSDAVTGDQLYTTNNNIVTARNDITSLSTSISSTNGTVSSLSTSLSSSNTTMGSLSTTLGTLSTALGSTSSDVALVKSQLNGEFGRTQIGTGAIAARTESIAIGSNAATNALGGIAIGSGASVGSESDHNGQGDVSVALGQNAKTTSHSSVALGAGSVADRDNAVAVGSSVTQRQIINVAAGTALTDAVNLQQLTDAIANVEGGSTDPLAVKYDSDAKNSVTLGNTGTAVKIDNVAAGTLSSTSTEAVNGSQLFATNTRVGSLEGALTDGGVIVKDGDGNMTSLAVTYGSASKDSVTLGNVGTPVTIHNVAVGVLSSTSTDAVNGSQLYGTAQSVASTIGGGTTVGADGKLTNTSIEVNGDHYDTVEKAIQAAATSGATDSMAVKYDDSNRTSVTLGGTGATEPIVLSNVATGVKPTDAVNVQQMQDAVASSSTSNSYVGGRGTGTAAQATGINAVALGINSLASELNTVSVGNSTTGLQRRITNVQNGQRDNDAATVGQVNELMGVASTNVQAAIDGIDTKTMFAIRDVNERLDSISTFAGTDPYVQVDGAGDGTDNAFVGADTYGVAIGGEASATGVMAISIGAQSKSSGLGSIALGADASATADGAVAFNGNAAGKDALALGNGTNATGNNSIAAGPNAGASGLNALAFGNTARANATGSMAFGTAAQVDSAATNSIAIGGGANVTSAALNSVALGAGSAADRANSLSVGSAAQQRQIINVAAGTADTDAVNLKQLADAIANVEGGGGGTDPLAVTYDSDAKNSVTLGSAGTAVKLDNVAAGTLSSTSAEAVNGSQLFATNQQVDANKSDIAGLTNGTIGLVQQSVAGAALTVGAATGGTSVNFAGTSGDRKLTGVAAGESNTDAVNLQQLTDAIANIEGGGTDPLAVTYDSDAKNSVTLGSAGTAVKIDNVAAGALSSTSAEAVNGSQLFATNQQVDANKSDIAGLTNGTIGLVQQSVAGAALTVGAATGGASVNFAGTAGDRKLTGVAAGVGNTDAVNVSQLSGVTDVLGGGAKVGTDGSIVPPSYQVNGNTYTNVADAIDAAARSGATDPNSVQYDGTARDSVTLGGTGSSTPVALHNVAAGAVNASSLDAMNGSQLHGTAQSVATAISGNTTVGSDGKLTAAISVNGENYTTVEGAIQAAAQTGSGVSATSVLYDNEERTQLTLGGLTKAGAAVKLTNVANGAIAAGSSDAVNGSQLYDTAQSVASTIGGGTTVGTDGKLANTSIEVNGDRYETVEKAIQAAAASSATDSMAVKYDDDSRTSVTLGGTGATAPIVLSNVANGVSQYDAVNFGQLSELASKVGDVDGRVSILEQAPAGGAGGSGGSTGGSAADWDLNAGGEKITNVGSATEKTDAVNLGQMNDAIQASVGLPAGTTAKDYTDQQIQGVRGQINDVSKNAYSGIAAATALTMIPGVDPGKTLSFGIGGATYKGYQAVAFGGEARVNQNLKVKAGVGLSSGGNTVGMGASYQW
ncbi:YadA-like family protein [Burkholderia pyrrocinia]|uniref:YadA-like family protein n=1 Tax=Burkholderia sp. IT-111MI5 TaxID=3026439 RepID=UPI002A2CA712|nr:YadA-like family protein [Burkholderia pyrrocinia]EKS9895890.1 YadA-like family protein [Burkholderia pyrrocinia]EKS9908563.1 YadA-like family protein [Burkholderia pyrrocinia]